MHVPKSSSGLNNAYLANIVFDVNDNNQVHDQDSLIVSIDKKNENSGGFCVEI